MTTEKEKQEYKDKILQAMNPIPEKDFDPDTFEPKGEKAKELSFRTRKIPTKQLPTNGLKPKEILEGQMIGLYESKQDLYLIMAHRCNDLQNQIDILTEEINKLK